MIIPAVVVVDWVSPGMGGRSCNSSSCLMEMGASIPSPTPVVVVEKKARGRVGGGGAFSIVEELASPGVVDFGVSLVGGVDTENPTFQPFESRSLQVWKAPVVFHLGPSLLLIYHKMLKVC